MGGKFIKSIKNILSDSNDLSVFSRELEKLLLKEALSASKGKRIEAAKILGFRQKYNHKKNKGIRFVELL